MMDTTARSACDHRQAGLIGGVAELMIVLVAGIILAAAYLPLQTALQRTALGSMAAWQIRTIREAADSYIRDNWATVYPWAATPQVLTLAMLQSAGYLSPSINGNNPWQQTHAVLLVQAGASQLAGLVVTTGGNAIPPEMISQVAALSGEYGGYVPYATDPVPCAPAPCAKGVGLFWQASLSPYAATGLTPSAGHLASALFYSSGQATAPYLYRYAQPNNPDATTMHAAIDMNGNDIDAAQNITATNQVTTGELIDYHDNSYYLTPSGASNLNNLSITGTITAPEYLHSSDERLKTDIADIDDPLGLVARLKGHRFRWKADGGDDIGLIAQEVRAVLPEAVKPGGNGYLAVKYDVMVAPLIEAVKSLSARVDLLQARLAAARGGAPDLSAQ